MSKHRSTEEWDEEDDDYLAKVPTRFQTVVRKPKQEQIERPWGWD